ncbi:MAG: MepB family protein [Bacteroidia bacterium]|nr:MepB family protein [Bacteroidia bacterium]
MQITHLDEMLFKPSGIHLSQLEAEPESKEYCAHNFKIGTIFVKFRRAKITPTKIGQFVTIWKRNKDGLTEPFNVDDPFDLLIIAVYKNDNLGIFVFPKTVLSKYKIVSVDSVEGKRGIRVYPSWDIAVNKQAQQTQIWQTQYFVNLTHFTEIDKTKAIDLIEKTFKIQT